MPVLEPDGRAPKPASRGPRAIRVLFLAAQVGRVSNGVGTYATALVDALARAGHEVTLVTASSASVGGSVRTRRVSPAALDPSPGQWLSLARAFALVDEPTATRWLDGFTAVVAEGAFVMTLNYYGAVGTKPA